MKVTVISSGSKGNSTLVETKSKNILIDAGISSKEIKKRLNKDINIDLLFITHAHIDHIKGLKSVYKEFKPTVFTRNEEVIEKNICDITYFDKPYILDDLEVSYFNLSHDSDCIGIKIKENNKELVYITDTGYINKKILTTIVNKDMYIIESNHDVELLMNGKYPFFLKESLRMLKPNGVILADNILYKGYVMSDYNKHKQRTAVRNLREYIKEVTENPNIETEILEVGDGLAVSKII